MKAIKNFIGYYWAMIPDTTWFGDASPYCVGSGLTFVTFIFYISPILSLLTDQLEEGPRSFLKENGVNIIFVLHWVAYFAGFFFKDTYYKLHEKYKYEDLAPIYCIFMGSIIWFGAFAFIL